MLLQIEYQRIEQLEKIMFRIKKLLDKIINREWKMYRTKKCQFNSARTIMKQQFKEKLNIINWDQQIQGNLILGNY